MATECFCGCCWAERFMTTGWPGAVGCFASWSALSPPVTDATGKATTGTLISTPAGTDRAGAGPLDFMWSTQTRIPREPTQQTRPPAIAPIKITGTAAAELELPP